MVAGRFYIPDSYARSARATTCAGRAYSFCPMLTKTCAQCGKQFSKGKNISLRAWFTKTKFCSHKCYSASKETDTPPEVRKEQTRKASRIWRERHPKESHDVQKRWKENNPERYLELDHHHQQKRRARLMNADGSITPDEWYSLCERYGFHCLRCGKEFPFEKLTLDHVIPLVKGGEHSIGNAQPLCFNCNCQKHAKHIDYRPKWD